MYRVTVLDTNPQIVKVEVGQFPRHENDLFSAKKIAKRLAAQAEIIAVMRGDETTRRYTNSGDLVLGGQFALSAEDIEAEINRTALRIWTMQNDLQSAGQLLRQVAEMEMENNHD